MVRHYTKRLLNFYPIVQEGLLNQIFQSISQTDSELHISHFESFVAYIVLAISSVSLYWKTGPQARSASLSLFSSAFHHLQQIVEIQELESFQAVLLLAHYAHLNPELIDIWTCNMTATRIVLDLGLYAAVSGEKEELYQRLFWVTYCISKY